jgi:hypothetical protein
MNEQCRLIPYTQPTTLRKRLAILWYNLRRHRQWVWQKEELLYRGVSKGDAGYDDAPVAFGFPYHKNAFESFTTSKQ